MSISRAGARNAHGTVPQGLLVQSWKIPLPHPRQAGIQQGTCSKPARIRTTPDPAISVILSLKLCSTLSEEKKKIVYNVQAFRSPPSTNTYFSPTFGGTWSLHSGPTSMWKLPASKIPRGGGRKTSLPVQPKRLSLSKVSGRMPSPLLS